MLISMSAGGVVAKTVLMGTKIEALFLLYFYSGGFLRPV